MQQLGCLRGHPQKTSARVEEGVKKKRTHADMGGDGGQAKVDIHTWFKIQVFNCSVAVGFMTPKSINIHCN